MATINLKQNTNFKIDPTQFTVWVFLVSVVMLFAGLTSAYIVRKAQGDWTFIELPPIFLTSCFVAIGSSIAIAGAQIAFRNGKKLFMQLGLLASLILGILFILNQFAGWEALIENNYHLSGTPSESFLFVISGIHAIHAGAGILAIAVTLLRSFLLSGEEIKTQKIHSIAIYWHFVGLLWIYLYIFLNNA